MMDQSSVPSIADPVARLERTLCGSKAREKLESALIMLDHIGADLAAAHVARAIDALEDRFALDANRSKAEQALQLPFPGS